MRNTKEKGMVRILFISHKDRCEAVCLDFDLIEEGRTREEVQKEIMDSVRGHIIAVRKSGLSDDLLNRRAAPKYWKIYKEYCKRQAVEDLVNLKESVCTYLIKDFVKA